MRCKYKKQILIFKQHKFHWKLHKRTAIPQHSTANLLFPWIKWGSSNLIEKWDLNDWDLQKWKWCLNWIIVTLANIWIKAYKLVFGAIRPIKYDPVKLVEWDFWRESEEKKKQKESKENKVHAVIVDDWSRLVERDMCSSLLSYGTFWVLSIQVGMGLEEQAARKKSNIIHVVQIWYWWHSMNIIKSNKWFKLYNLRQI
jgi:hypothetical protein